MRPRPAFARVDARLKTLIFSITNRKGTVFAVPCFFDVLLTDS